MRRISFPSLFIGSIVCFWGYTILLGHMNSYLSLFFGNISSQEELSTLVRAELKTLKIESATVEAHLVPDFNGCRTIKTCATEETSNVYKIEIGEKIHGNRLCIPHEVFHVYDGERYPIIRRLSCVLIVSDFVYLFFLEPLAIFYTVFRSFDPVRANASHGV